MSEGPPRSLLPEVTHNFLKRKKQDLIIDGGFIAGTGLGSGTSAQLFAEGNNAMGAVTIVSSLLMGGVAYMRTISKTEEIGTLQRENQALREQKRK